MFIITYMSGYGKKSAKSAAFFIYLFFRESDTVEKFTLL